VKRHIRMREREHADALDHGAMTAPEVAADLGVPLRWVWSRVGLLPCVVHDDGRPRARALGQRPHLRRDASSRSTAENARSIARVCSLGPAMSCVRAAFLI